MSYSGMRHLDHDVHGDSAQRHPHGLAATSVLPHDRRRGGVLSHRPGILLLTGRGRQRVSNSLALVLHKFPYICCITSHENTEKGFNTITYKCQKNSLA